MPPPFTRVRLQTLVCNDATGRDAASTTASDITRSYERLSDYVAHINARVYEGAR